MQAPTSSLPDREAAHRRCGELKICLAASGGGHVRQLLDLQAVWSKHPHFFVTEDTALGQTLQRDHRTYFVPHYAWGQLRLKAPLKMLAGAWKSFFHSLSIIRRERPDVVISTGAGAVIFPVLFGRLLGARVIAIESFARFEHPSLFGRVARWIATDMVIQSPKLARNYPGAKVFDPLRMLDGAPPPKKELVFATVGATLPFERLVETVGTLKAEGTIPEDVFVQTGVGGPLPPGVEGAETLPFDRVQSILRDAKIVICHGGTGSIITALRQGCHVIAVPRLADKGEHYDDHQAEITDAFRQRGLVFVANTADEMRAALAQARSQSPKMATTDPQGLISYLEDLMAAVQSERTRGGRERIPAG